MRASAETRDCTSESKEASSSERCPIGGPVGGSTSRRLQCCTSQSTPVLQLFSSLGRCSCSCYTRFRAQSCAVPTVRLLPPEGLAWRTRVYARCSVGGPITRCSVGGRARVKREGRDFKRGLPACAPAAADCRTPSNTQVPPQVRRVRELHVRLYQHAEVAGGLRGRVAQAGRAA